MKSDFILPFQLVNNMVRGRILRLDGLVREIISRHNYPLVVNRALAEAIALSAAVFNCFKFEGTFTLQINGKGPVSLLVVDITSQGHVRATARLEERSLEKIAHLNAASVQQLFGTGYLAFTIDPQGNEERYQGIVELSGSTLAECMHHFFRQSEQLETGIIVLSDPLATDKDTGAIVGALMVQRLPINSEIEREEADDIWVKSLSAVGTVHHPELLSSELSLEELLHRLFWEDGVQVYQPKGLTAQCRCSRDKIDIMLHTFDKGALAEMVVEDKISVKCEFCNQSYDFDAKELV